LPRADIAPAVPAAASANPAPAPAEARLLLVEDDREVAQAAQALLDDLGFETRWAGDGNQALALIEGGLAIDLVLSDVVMPGGMSGLDLARRLRQRRPELPVILGTGYSRQAAQVVSEGFALIEKPYRYVEVAAALRLALERRRPST
jgi:CheY-like chemotaxis protein